MRLVKTLGMVPAKLFAIKVEILRHQGVSVPLFLLLLGTLLPALCPAETSKELPTHYLAVASFKAMAQTPEYAKLNAYYEKNKRDQGEVWLDSPEGKAMAGVRESLQKSALSAKIEIDENGRDNIVFTYYGRKAVLGSAPIPSDLADERQIGNVADTIADLIIVRAAYDASYQAAMVAIDAAENPPLPDINRSSATMVLGAFVEPPALYQLWLPEPGPSTRADLLPRAEEARERGLAAASSGNWPAAVVAFKEANKFAHASPPLMFNLALAYQRGGWSVPAAMWYRTYLAALPDAPKAAEIRLTIQQLIAETEARSLREFDEAERLADLLSDTPPAAGRKSLRQIALEDMASYAYMGGLTDRGDALSSKALALPGAKAAAEEKEYPDKYGLYAAAYSWDAKRVEDIIARFGSEYTQEMIFNYRTYALGNRGDLAEVRRIVAAYPSGILSDNNLGSSEDKNWIYQTRYFEILEIMHGLRLEGAKELDDGTLLPDLHSIFWNGRPDIAQRLARRAVEHYLKLNPGGYVRYLIPNAILGDRKAIVQEMERWKSNRMNVSLDASVIEIAAMYVAASMTPADAAATIMDMIRLSYNDLFISTGIKIPETSWPNGFPESYFVLAIAKGDSSGALKYFGHGNEPVDEKYQKKIWRALRFAVATGRTQLAFDLSNKLPHHSETLYQLHRLAANPGASESVRERVSRYATPLSGGWRPVDANHAQKVLFHLKHALRLKDEKQYGFMPDDVEKTAKEKPEELPAYLAAHALVLWMGAMAARLGD